MRMRRRAGVSRNVTSSCECLTVQWPENRRCAHQRSNPGQNQDWIPRRLMIPSGWLRTLPVQQQHWESTASTGERKATTPSRGNGIIRGLCLEDLSQSARTGLPSEIPGRGIAGTKSDHSSPERTFFKSAFSIQDLAFRYFLLKAPAEETTKAGILSPTPLNIYLTSLAAPRTQWTRRS